MKKKRIIGIDLSDTTLDVAVVLCTDTTQTVEATHHVLVPPGLIVNGALLDVERVADFVKEQCHALNVDVDIADACSWVLPQCVTYTYVHTQSLDAQTVTSEALIQSATTLAPFEASQLAISHLHPDSQHDIVVVSSKQIIAQWHACARAVCGDVVYHFFLEGYAMLMGVSMPQEHGAYVIIDVGGRSTTVTSVVDGSMSSVVSIPIAGVYMTHEISRIQGCTVEDAERQKQQGSIATSNSLSTILVPIVETLSERIRSAIAFQEKKLGLSFQSAVYVGGSLRMNGLRAVVQKRIGLIEVPLPPRDTVPDDSICAVGAAFAVSSHKIYALFVNQHPTHICDPLVHVAKEGAVHDVTISVYKKIQGTQYREVIILLILCVLCVAVWFFFLF